MNFFAGSQCRGCGLVFTHKPACPYAPGPVIPPNSLVPSEAFVVPLEDPNDPSADEWDPGDLWQIIHNQIDGAVDVGAAISDAVNEIVKLVGTRPDPSADEWARLDAANADEDATGRVVEVLLGHQLSYISEAKTYDCSCDELGQLDWMPTITEASQHQADALIAAGLIKGTS